MEKANLTKTQIRLRTIIAFSVFGLFMVGCVIIAYGIGNAPLKDSAPAPVRKAFEMNEQLFSGSVKKNHLAKVYPVSEAVKKVRVNGMYGLKDSVALSDWKMTVIRLNGDTLLVTLDDLKKLQKTDIVFDFKCIEGWSQVTHWAGVRFSDFIEAFHLEADAAAAYIGLVTPDTKYYVGIDMPSAIHPQTILCYEMNGKALPQDQGYPLRLIIPVKYGIKHLKRIGTLTFTDKRPADYWAERGYDYFSGL